MILISTSGKGKEICDYLREALNIPPNAIWFDVRFEVGAPVKVRCEFNAAEAPEPEEEWPADHPSHGSLDD